MYIDGCPVVSVWPRERAYVMVLNCGPVVVRNAIPFEQVYVEVVPLCLIETLAHIDDVE